jgi:RHS repeat-associated protein
VNPNISGAAAAAWIIEWLVTDQLGTPRMIFDKTGSLAGTKRHDYLPFGEELYANAGIRSTTLGYTAAGNTPADKVRQKFTEQERDDETGLDYMHARYFANVQGRFTSVDPLQVSARPRSPQSWNRYSYALNNPLRYSDPSGMTTSGAYSGDMDGPGVGNPQDSEDQERRRQEFLAQQAANEADAAALEATRNGQAGPESLIVRGTYDDPQPNAAGDSGPGDHGGEEGPGGEHSGQPQNSPSGTVSFYYWSLSKYGHAALVLDDGTYISFWPSCYIGAKDPPLWHDVCPARPADYEQDRAEENGKDPNSIKISGLDQQAIKLWWNNGKGHGGWSLWNNCSDIVSEALRIGGLPIRRTTYYTTPDYVKGEIERLLHERQYPPPVPRPAPMP